MVSVTSKAHWITALTLTAVCGVGHAQSNGERVWVHLGVAHVDFNSGATVSVPALGGQVQGQSASASNNTTLAFEVGYELAPRVIASATLGIPPTTTITGQGGPFAGAELGKVKYGPSVWTVHYHYDAGVVKPYFGAGLTYVLVFQSKDSTLGGLDSKNAWGSALQAGMDIPLNNQWFAFVDAKKLFVKAKPTFTSPAPGSATLKLDPLIVHAGIGFRY